MGEDKEHSISKQEELQKKYPEILGGVWLSVKDGWLPIIKKLCASLMNTENPPVAVQVKEKFGGLRFYVDRSSQEQDDLIRLAEGKASRTCEVCGAPGALKNDRGWYRTSCGKH